MNYVITMLGFVMVAGATTEGQRTIGAVLAGAGLNDVLRDRRS